MIASESTLMRFDHAVPLGVTERLAFVSGNTPKQLKFSSPGHLDRQTLRGVRELDSGSAAELDKLLS